MRLPPKERSIPQIEKISFYIEKNKLYNKLKTESKLDESSLQKILLFICYNLEYRDISKNTIIFREGDLGEEFFIIIQGEVEVLQLEFENTFHTYIEYFDLIKELYNLNEIFLVKEIIDKNHKKIPLAFEDITYIEEIAFYLELNRKISFPMTLTNLLDYFTENNRKPEDYGIVLKSLNIRNHDMLVDFARKVNIKPNRGKLPKFIKIDYFCQILSSSKTYYSLEIGKYVKKMSLKEGQYFGDFALDSKRKIR